MSYGYLREKVKQIHGANLALVYDVVRSDEKLPVKMFEYTVACSVRLQVTYERSKTEGQHLRVRQERLHCDSTEYQVTMSSVHLNFKAALVCDDERFVRVGIKVTDFDIEFDVNIKPTISKFPSFHQDSELTDFELRGDGGSIRVHKFLLAAYSPVFKRMLEGEWKEKAEGYVNVPGTCKDSLQHFKDYLYMHTLPNEGLEELLLLASCYMIPDLAKKCIYKLVENMTAERAFNLLEFAHKYNNRELIVAVIYAANADQMQELILQEKKEKKHQSE